MGLVFLLKLGIVTCPPNKHLILGRENGSVKKATYFVTSNMLYALQHGI